ncbi:MAG: hypothetical protein ACYSU0_08195 [Planctomycetota bacterium]|jgi:hypothetical protein
MRRFPGVAAVALMVVLAVGCTPLQDPDAAGYGVMQRAGISAAVYVPVASAMADQGGYLASHDLGLGQASSVELEYAFPLERGFELRVVLGFADWEIDFPTPPTPLPPLYVPWPEGEEATWNTTSLMVLLTDGWRWGRFGVHVSAGPGVLFNDLDWVGSYTETSSSFAVQTNLGLTCMITQYLEVGLEVGYRASRAGYATDRMAPFPIADDQILNSLILKGGLYYLF